MKPSKSFTFNIIKSLNPSEKAYVSKQISSGSKHLIQLFNDLNKCDNYQKSKFIQKNNRKKYVPNLSQNKNYLGRKIIEALISYRAKSTIEIEVYNHINEIHVLIDKKFYTRARRLIDRTLEKVVQVENYVACYTIVEIIFRTLNNQVHFELEKEDIILYKKERHFFLEQLNRIEIIAQLNDIYHKYNGSNLLLEKYQKKMEELNLNDKRKLPPDYPFQAKRTFYFAKATIYKLKNQPKEFIYFSKKVIKLYEENEHLLKYHCVLFLGDSVNYLDYLIMNGNYRIFFKEQKRIRELINKYKAEALNDDNSVLDIINYLFPQTAYNYGKYFDQALQFSNEYLTYIENNDGKLSDHFKAVSSIHITYANLYNHKYAKAIEYIEQALNFKDYGTQYLARILQILAHYLSGDDLLLDHLFRSFFNYLKTVDKKDQINNIRKLRDHIKNKTIHLLKNEDFEEFVYIHWDEFEEKE